MGGIRARAKECCSQIPPNDLMQIIAMPLSFYFTPLTEQKHRGAPAVQRLFEYVDSAKFSPCE